MNIASMFLRILAILGAIAAGVMFWMIGDTKDKLESDLQSTESQLNQTQSNLTTVRGEHEELQETAAALTRDLEETQARATNLENQLTQARRELAEANQAITTRDREAAALKSEATRIRRELLDERARLTELEQNLESEDSGALRDSIRQLEEQLLARERQLQEMGGTDNATASTQSPEAPRAEVLRGKVTEVGDGSAFVVIDLGSEAGVRPNSSVMIRRGPRYVGRATIREVKENTSVAEVSPGADRIQAGDMAVTLN